MVALEDLVAMGGNSEEITEENMEEVMVVNMEMGEKVGTMVVKMGEQEEEDWMVEMEVEKGMEV